MKILNFGSLNIDHFYDVDHFVKPGETLLSNDYNLSCGGKGLNQSIAIAKTGLPVYHAGKIGNDGNLLLQKLNAENINTENVKIGSGATGHAIIQVNQSGENCIILHGGENQNISEKEIETTLQNFNSGDILVLQNEINNMKFLIHAAKAKGLKIVFNPAPANHTLNDLPIDQVDYLICNETEGFFFSKKTDLIESFEFLNQNFPNSTCILTAGSDGVYFKNNQKTEHLPSLKVKAIDTTSAGDTFIGYLAYGIFNNFDLKETIQLASKAASITVTRKGAAESIPSIDEVTKIN